MIQRVLNNPPAGHCPLCGGSNDCAVSAGQDPASCWCFAPDVVFSPAVKQAAQQARDSAAGAAEYSPLACICRACVQKYSADGADNG
ncbi:MAG: hypothetical protein CMI02_00770 [Oceanospirillaceae bacterium]|nr:hypothetical protein [Oceanospirillaceae bacterium]MBT10551.1 hypothetical protein [Oceanospirillaceae bacterium]|tara:strand:- start:131189 stop:131449 length:261 start_codon:yes stop_codon:yes gene_type:complete